MGGRLDPAVAHGRQLVRRSLADLDPGDRILVALSGGADSVALAAVTAFVAAKEGIQAGAVVVDHGLQPDSAQTAARALETAQSLGLEPAEVVSVDVDGPGGPEGAAREARYRAIRAQSTGLGSRAVLLGHTRDDQAETVLLGLARGSGPRSLAAMAPVDGLWRRPFLSLAREQTRAICAASGLSWWEDPHNADPTFTRVRIRTSVMPVLESAIGPGASEALARTADLLRADADLLDDLAASARADVTDADGALVVAALGALPDALRTRVIRAAAIASGAPAEDLALGHVTEVDRLVSDWHGQIRIELPGAVVAARVDGTIRFTLGASR